MKTRLSLVIGVALVLAVLVMGLSQAQGPADPDDQALGDGEGVEVQPLAPPAPEDEIGAGEPYAPDLAGLGEAATGPLSEVAAAETVSSTFSYQGVLKENGEAVTGEREMAFRLYNDAGCSRMVGSPLTFTVAVEGGLFDVNLPVSAADVNGQGLWLETAVGGTSVGCQPVLATPYALSLRPGAVISGTVGPGDALLNVQSGASGVPGEGLYGGKLAGNAGLWGAGVYGYANIPSAPGVGVWGWGRSNGAAGVLGWASAVTGTNYGVWGASASPEGYAGNFSNEAGGVDVMASGSGVIRSVAESKIAANPYHAVVDSRWTDELELWMEGSGHLKVWPLVDGSVRIVYVPVDVTTQMFGVPQKLESVDICYQMMDATSYITRAQVRQFRDNGSYLVLFSDEADRTSDSFTCDTLTVATPEPVGGPLLVAFSLNFGGTGSGHAINIGQITLTLVE